MERALADRYVLGELIGRGGMSEVYAAHDERLSRAVAMKFLDASLVEDPAACERFTREARSAARVAHPNIVTVLDTGIDEGRPFIVMERLPGDTLVGEIRRGPVDAARATSVLTDILRALEAAHQAGVVHRDVKPGNVLCAGDGTVKVADFGIATVADSHDPALTTGLIATPAYLAPERLSGAAASPQSDLFAVGVIGYELLSGVRPFQGDSPAALLAAIAHGEHVPIDARIPDAPAGLVGTIERALSRDPTARFATAAEMLAELQRDPTNRPRVATDVSAASDQPTQRLETMTSTHVMPMVPARPCETSTRPRRARRRSSRARWMSAAATVLLAVAIVGGLLVFTRDDPTGLNSNAVETTATATATAAPVTSPVATLPPSLERSVRELERAVGR